MAELSRAPGRLHRLRSVGRHIGPALVLATVVIDPGSLTLNTIAGSAYGYSLLWVPIAATFLMIIYTWLSARISLVTGKTLFRITAEKYGNGLATTGGIFGYLAILAFQAGNSAAVGFAANALLGGDVRLWATVLSAIALGLIFLPSLYGKLEVLVKIIVGVMLVAFAGTLAVVGIDVGPAARGVVPSLPDRAAVFLMLGMTATTFSIAAAVYQGYLMKEKRWGREDLRTGSLDTLIGIGILGCISIVVLLTSAGAVFGTGLPIDSAQAMAAQLEPLVGPGAFYLFTLGFFFASFSSLVVNPLIGATLLVDGLGQDPSMDGRPVKRWTSIAMAAGLGIVLIFEAPPIEVIRFAQALAVVAFPLLGFLVLSIARDGRIMGEYTSRKWVQIVAGAGYLIILAIVLNYVRVIVAML